MKIRQLKNKLQNFISQVKKIAEKNSYAPCYRVTEITQDKEKNYIVNIQMINKNITFKTRPEEILANDDMVDLFSPRDIRTLTYLGYLGINSPKYKILAKRLSEKDDKLLFAIKKKGLKKILIKTADEINKEKEILESLPPTDARIIGYTLASESFSNEKKQKEKILNKLN